MCQGWDCESRREHLINWSHSNCNPPEAGAGDHTVVLCKSSIHSPDRSEWHSQYRSFSSCLSFYLGERDLFWKHHFMCSFHLNASRHIASSSIFQFSLAVFLLMGIYFLNCSLLCQKHLDVSLYHSVRSAYASGDGRGTQRKDVKLQTVFAS